MQDMDEMDDDLRSEAANIYGSDETLASFQRCSDSNESCSSDDDDVTRASEIGVSTGGIKSVLNVATANITIQSFSYRPDSVLSMAASLLSIQGVTTAPVNQQRPLPPVPRKCYAQEITVNITSAEITDNARTISEKAPPSALGQHDQLAITTSPHQRAHIQKEKRNINAPSLLCCRTRKYAKVTEAFPKRKNMSWLLRKRTLLAFSTMSLVFSLFSCGLLLCLKLRPLFDSHDRLDPTCPKDNRTDSELRNLSVTGYMCYEDRQKLNEILEDGLARKGIKPKTSDRLINGSECSLTVQTTGWFFVYSSVTVNVTNCTATKQWSHVIVHLPKNDSLTNRTLTQSVRTCCSDCPNYVETSFTGGIYRLEDGDDVFVRLDLPSTGSSNQTCISLVNVGRG